MRGLTVSTERKQLSERALSERTLILNFLLNLARRRGKHCSNYFLRIIFGLRASPKSTVARRCETPLHPPRPTFLRRLSPLCAHTCPSSPTPSLPSRYQSGPSHTISTTTYSYRDITGTLRIHRTAIQWRLVPPKPTLFSLIRHPLLVRLDAMLPSTRPDLIPTYSQSQLHLPSSSRLLTGVLAQASRDAWG